VTDRCALGEISGYGGGSYEIRIKRRLSDSLLAVFEGLTASVEPVEPVEPVLHGPVQDQAVPPP
jgi:hypothetical protein